MLMVILCVSAVILLCVLAEKFSDKFGTPALILFMFIGMVFGSDGLFKIPFDNFSLAENICSIALIFIMFYGGFNTKWSLAKPVAVRSVILSSFGVVVTALITAVLCYLFLHFSFEESFLVGSVLASTDAASVFAILRRKKLNLKHGTASLLELESGSNDPMAYLLTMIGISLMGGNGSENMILEILLQIAFGLFAGVVFARISLRLMSRRRIIADGLDSIFLIAMVLMCYSVAGLLHGNAYLSIYIMGIIMGNSSIRNKKVLVPFFDGITSLSQILIFFLLGLLTFPNRMPQVIVTALAVTIFLTFIARPIAVFALMLPFRCSIPQCLLISWAGLRGAASSVFAIMAVASGIPIDLDLFHIVFMVSLFSVSVQGTLLPMISRKLDMVDDSMDVRKTFNDYQEESSLTLMRMAIPAGHNWENQLIRDVSMPTGSLALMIKRNGENIIPRGDTRILAGDNVILSVPSYESGDTDVLEEIPISEGHKWCNLSLAELKLPANELIALIKRGDKNIIPDGRTIIRAEDTLVLYVSESK
ncbi:MAG: potassium/proton antiporter [Lachnospiraceae bacterium]